MVAKNSSLKVVQTFTQRLYDFCVVCSQKWWIVSKLFEHFVQLLFHFCLLNKELILTKIHPLLAHSTVPWTARNMNCEYSLWPIVGLGCKQSFSSHLFLSFFIIRKGKKKPVEPEIKEDKPYLEEQYVNSFIRETSEIRELVPLPPSIDFNEWIATNSKLVLC